MTAALAPANMTRLQWEQECRAAMVREANRRRRDALTIHDGARRDRTTRDWRTNLATADQEILEDLDILLARSRQACRDDGFARSAQGGYRRYVVGSGITARSAARHPGTGKPLEGWNQALDALWQDWIASPELCDTEKTCVFAEKQWLWCNELFAAGGVLLVENYRRMPNGVGLNLQEIEAEQFDTVKTEHNGRRVIDGVEVDDYGAPLAYHVYVREHPLDDYASQSVRVPAERARHLFRKDRIRQKRGLPWMSTVLRKLRNLAMYEQYMAIKARTEAAYTGFMQRTGGGGPSGLPGEIAKRIGAAGSGQPSAENSNEMRVVVEPGVFPYVPQGHEVKFAPSSNPNSEYGNYVAQQLKGISAGAGLDLTTVARWYADGNFSSQRQAKLDIYAETDPIQQVLFIQKTLQWVRQRFVTYAVTEGKLNAPGFLENRRWRRAYLQTDWQGPAKPPIDLAKYAAAMKLLQGLKLKPPQHILNELGQDIRDVYAAFGEARDIADRNQIEVPGINAPSGGTDPREPRPGKAPADMADDDLNRIGMELILDAIRSDR